MKDFKWHDAIHDHPPPPTWNESTNSRIAVICRSGVLLRKTREREIDSVLLRNWKASSKRMSLESTMKTEFCKQLIVQRSMAHGDCIPMRLGPMRLELAAARLCRATFTSR